MSGLDSLYQELILDHSKRPIGKGALEAPAGTETYSQHEYNPSCGDELELSIAIDPETGVIEQLAWEGQGCSISMASASVLAQLLRDEKWDEATARERIEVFRQMLRNQGADVDPEVEELIGDGIAFQGVGKFVMRVKCAMLSWVALEANLTKFAAAHK